MPRNRTTCPHCNRAGFIRLERVITGGASEHHYHCRACDHSWDESTPRRRHPSQATHAGWARPESRPPDRASPQPPFAYVRDDARRRIRVTAYGPLRLADVTAIVDRQAREHTWTYGIAYDFRRMPTPLSLEEGHLLAAHISGHVSAHGPRGPVAIVTTAPDLIAGTQLYAFSNAPAGFNVQVFWDLEEAEAWLDDPTASSEEHS
jgi:hypothetical protein